MKKKNPPRFIFTCRDWMPGETTERDSKSYWITECLTCVDRENCKGPERYRRDK